MPIPLVQFRWLTNRIESIPPDYVLPIVPEPGYDRGRKAKLLHDLWWRNSTAGWPGLVVMDPDVVIDPDDLVAMYGSSYEHPGEVGVAPVKLWPASTQLPEWIWAHRGGSLGYPAATQDEGIPIAYWTTCFTYLPGRLLDAAAPMMAAWQWLELDVKLPELALQLGIASRLVPAARPKHLHF